MWHISLVAHLTGGRAQVSDIPPAVNGDAFDILPAVNGRAFYRAAHAARGTRTTPTEKAGIRENDVIVTIAGLPVKNIETYMAAMSGQKIGAEVEVVVLRKDKKLTVKVVPVK